jgi:hypothetical protein
MPNDELSPSEREFLYSWRRSTPLWHWIAYYTAILVPLTAFAIYGLVQRDVIAMAIAFGGLLLYTFYNAASQIGRGAQYRDVAARMLAREEARGAAD